MCVVVRQWIVIIFVSFLFISQGLRRLFLKVYLEISKRRQGHFRFAKTVEERPQAVARQRYPPLQQEMETNRTLITLGCVSPAAQRFRTRSGRSGSKVPSGLLPCDTQTPPAGVLTSG